MLGWLRALTGTQVAPGSQNVHEALKDGQVLIKCAAFHFHFPFPFTSHAPTNNTHLTWHEAIAIYHVQYLSNTAD